MLPSSGFSARAAVAHKIDEITAESEARYKTGIKELDRVLGGGLVKGSLVLLSGEPGIGKSTMLLQICGKLSTAGKILYVSAGRLEGEEASKTVSLKEIEGKKQNARVIM